MADFPSKFDEVPLIDARPDPATPPADVMIREASTGLVLCWVACSWVVVWREGDRG